MSPRPGPFNEYRVEGDTAVLVLRCTRGPKKGEVVGETRIDAADLPALIEDGRPWSLHSTGYAWRGERHGGKFYAVMLHRQLVNPPDDLVIDHLNRDRLDNRRANLRVCTQVENMANLPRISTNTSGVKNVYVASRSVRRPFIVQIRRHGKGLFRCPCRTLNVARITASLARREHDGADYA
ncbi:hypothetical protein DM785_02430 [Deinococcus actinosclerus]|nr:hypothetical protein DM785_02430 [Deinococcus actinosclerus]